MKAQTTIPDYKRIYSDLIAERFPDKIECTAILNKKRLTELDIIKLNALLFNDNNRETIIFNQMHRSYNKKTIIEILDYQKKNNLNNVQLANHFRLSRNTVAKWRKLFLV
jgi:hypothetical protein